MKKYGIVFLLLITVFSFSHSIAADQKTKPKPEKKFSYLSKKKLLAAKTIEELLPDSVKFIVVKYQVRCSVRGTKYSQLQANGSELTPRMRDTFRHTRTGNHITFYLTAKKKQTDVLYFYPPPFEFVVKE